MNHYDQTGVLKSGEQRISRPVSALLVEASQAFTAFTNEKATIYIERAGGNNSYICTNVPLSALLPLSAYGVPNIIEESGAVRSVVPLADGAIELGENESIKFSLTDLKSTVTYKVSSIESHESASAPFMFDRKVMNSDETAKKFEIPNFSALMMDNFDQVTQIFVTHSNGKTTKYDPSEIKAIAEISDPFYLIVDGVAKHSPTNGVILNVNGVTAIELQKNAGTAVNLTLKRL